MDLVGQFGNKLMGFLACILLAQTGFAADRFCVQTFNAYGPAYAARLLDRTIEFGRELQNESPCDLYQLQEIWTGKHQERLVDIFTSNHFSFILNPSRFERVGLFTAAQIEPKKPYLGVYRHNKAGWADQMRGLFGVKKAFYAFQMNLGEDQILVINTHLHNANSPIRLAQLVQMIEYRIRFPRLGLVFTGDLNAEPQSLEYTLLTEGIGLKDGFKEFSRSYQDVCTYCDDNIHSWLKGDHVFDYVFYSNAISQKKNLEVLKASINLKGQTEKPLSDHYGVRVEFEVLPKKLSSPSDKKELAIKALKKVKLEFENEGSRVFHQEIQVLGQWINDLTLDKKESNFYKIVMEQN